MSSNSILITIDVEDWFQVENLRPWFPPETWDKQQSRVEQNTIKLLDLFDSIKLPNLKTANHLNSNNSIKPSNSKNAINSTNSKSPINSTNTINSVNSKNSPRSVQATFFVLGWIAERYPNIVKEITSRGHEVASHGYNHLMCNKISQSELLRDLIKSKKLLEDLTGNNIIGYRAPSFSISDEILKIIEKAGYQYDSSYNSFDKHGRYGTITPNGGNKTHNIINIGSSFKELPISNLRIAKQTIPWGGGGYFRLLPPTIFKAGVKNIINTTGSYLFYLHPWEIDQKQPRVKTAKGLTPWRHYLNLNKTKQRLIDFINNFSYCNFKTCSQYIKEAEGKTQKTQQTQKNQQTRYFLGEKCLNQNSQKTS